MADGLNSESIIKENQSLMREIIRIWSDLARDPDLGVRITTLLATVVGFACISAFSLCVLFIIKGGSEQALHMLLLGAFILIFIFIFMGFIIALRSSKRAPIRQLEHNFEEVSRHRYGEEPLAQVSNG